MTDNEKAAVAAGLWRLTAPDMHDPANLWRALENRRMNILVEDDFYNKRPLAETAFAALVALYDAEYG